MKHVAAASVPGTPWMLLMNWRSTTYLQLSNSETSRGKKPAKKKSNCHPRSPAAGVVCRRYLSLLVAAALMVCTEAHARTGGSEPLLMISSTVRRREADEPRSICPNTTTKTPRTLSSSHTTIPPPPKSGSWLLLVSPFWRSACRLVGYASLMAALSCENGLTGCNERL